MCTISFNPQNNPLRAYYYLSFTDEETESTPQRCGRNGIMNPESLTPESTVLTNTSHLLTMQGVFMRVCADRGPTGVQRLGIHETGEFDK